MKTIQITKMILLSSSALMLGACGGGGGGGNNTTTTAFTPSSPASGSIPFKIKIKSDAPVGGAVGSTSPTEFKIQTSEPYASGYVYDYDVDCDSDGNIDMYGANSNYICSYPSAGEYVISIYGDFPQLYLNGEMDKAKLLDVLQWGNIAWEDMSGSFQGYTGSVFSASDVPDLSAVTDMSAMFASSNFNGALSSWNVSSITNMSAMFYEAAFFNQDISTWNVSLVTDMSSMFYNAWAFNQNIGGWNVSAVERMEIMFGRAFAFNQDIGNWETSSVINMGSMFWTATAFNQDLSTWDVSAVTNMESMFNTATSFSNRDLSGWSVNAAVLHVGFMSNAGAGNTEPIWQP